MHQSNRYLKRRKYNIDEKDYARLWALKLKIIKFLGGKCKECGISNPMILELHHKNKKTKEDCMSDIIRKKKYNFSSGIKGIYKEAKKCDLLCRNCHQEFHNAKTHPKNEKNKKFIMSINKNNGRCDICGYNKNISCLEFHHRNPKNKKFSVSKLTDPRRNYDDMKISKDKFNSYVKEVKKCDILCCNCHQLKHIRIDKFEKLRSLIHIIERLIDYSHAPRF